VKRLNSPNCWIRSSLSKLVGNRASVETTLAAQLRMAAKLLRINPEYMKGIVLRYPASSADPSASSTANQAGRYLPPGSSPVLLRKVQEESWSFYFNEPPFSLPEEGVLQKVAEFGWDTAALWDLASLAWRAAIDLQKELEEIPISVDNSVYLEQLLRNKVQAFIRNSQLELVTAVVSHLSPDHAPWDAKWFHSKEEEDIESDPIACLRWFLCVAPGQELEHTLCEWHRNEATRRWLESNPPQAKSERDILPARATASKAITGVAYATSLAEMEVSLQDLQRGVEQLQDRSAKAVVKYVAHRLDHDNIRSWSMVGRPRELDQTNNRSENIFKALKLYDQGKHVPGILRAFKRLIGTPDSDDSFAANLVKKFTEQIAVRVDRARIHEKLPSIIEGHELYKRLSSSSRVERCSPWVYSVPDGEVAQRVDTRSRTCSCVQGTLGPYCKHQVAVYLLCTRKGLDILPRHLLFDSAVGLIEAGRIGYPSLEVADPGGDHQMVPEEKELHEALHAAAATGDRRLMSMVASVVNALVGRRASGDR
jgi:hypothetical protein